ncbi:hypothetical protein HDA40_000342 [Hamadaea flava]|uniref:DUF4129 domain-containing protein n=1 Tax=Hamadaea flava TaxID=1742688 RepID=A0ABV8LTL9_9ACTN|nr:hypothetical protein [Hamadaea flava]MCP2321835.1 hypothetical protein [Hamadaea flava]
MSMGSPGEPRRVGRLRSLVSVGGVVGLMAAVVVVPFAAIALLLPVTVAVLVASLVVLFRDGRGPAAFVASGRAFEVPARWSVALLPLLWMVLASVQAGRLLRPRLGGEWADQVSPWDTALLATYAVLVGVWLVLALRRRSVALTPEGITRWGPLGRVEIPWAAVAPAQQAVVSHFLARWLHLAVAPGGVRRLGFVPFADELPLQELEVDSRFLADAIEFYVRHPERRAEIGSPSEHRRLFAELAEWYAAARPVAGPLGR